jgi:hypothetical protein
VVLSLSKYTGHPHLMTLQEESKMHESSNEDEIKQAEEVVAAQEKKSEPEPGPVSKTDS